MASSLNINKINDLYHSPAGEEIAAAELLPVIERYFPKKENSMILEVGCAFGRNLPALVEIGGAQVYACDIDDEALAKAKEKIIQKNLVDRVTLVKQVQEDQLPFNDNQFNVVIAWQLLEHIFNFQIKKKIIQEMVRVCSSGGLIIIETPNAFFPIDYHDSALPFVHWFLPRSWRQFLIRKVRGRNYPPSEYINIFKLEQLLKSCGAKVNKLSVIYFEKNYQDILKHLGGTTRVLKKLFFVFYWPVYCLLKIFHLPADTFTPSLRVVYQIIKE